MKSVKQQLIRSRNKNYDLRDQFHPNLLINVKYSILYTITNKLWFRPILSLYTSFDSWERLKNEIS